MNVYFLVAKVNIPTMEGGESFLVPVTELNSYNYAINRESCEEITITRKSKDGKSEINYILGVVRPDRVTVTSNNKNKHRIDIQYYNATPLSKWVVNSQFINGETELIETPDGILIYPTFFGRSINPKFFVAHYEAYESKTSAMMFILHARPYGFSEILREDDFEVVEINGNKNAFFRKQNNFPCLEYIGEGDIFGSARILNYKQLPQPVSAGIDSWLSSGSDYLHTLKTRIPVLGNSFRAWCIPGLETLLKID